MSVMAVDYVKCNNCGREMYVKCGMDDCPVCKMNGALTWADPVDQEFAMNLIGDWAYAPIWISANGNWTLEWKVRELDTKNPDHMKDYIMLSDGWSSYYPILYKDSTTVAYDYPELIPKYVQAGVKRALLKLRKEGVV